MVRDGKKYFKKQQVKNFQAGMILAVKVTAPEEIPEGELPIKIEAKPVMKGGKPKDEKSKGKEQEQGIKAGFSGAYDDVVASGLCKGDEVIGWDDGDLWRDVEWRCAGGGDGDL